MKFGPVWKSGDRYVPECEHAERRLVLLLFLLAAGRGRKCVYRFGNQIMPCQCKFKRQIGRTVKDPGQTVARYRAVCLIQSLDDRDQISVFDQSSDLRGGIRIRAVLLEQHRRGYTILSPPTAIILHLPVIIKLFCRHIAGGPSLERVPCFSVFIPRFRPPPASSKIKYVCTRVRILL